MPGRDVLWIRNQAELHNQILSAISEHTGEFSCASALDKYLLIKLNFSQFVNQNVKILGRRLHSPSLRDVAFL